MKTITKYFPLTTFIKNVQSATRKVGKFALNNIEYVLLGIGIVAKVCEAFFSNFNMPLSFYTDTALDMFLVWKGIKNLTADNKILRRRMVPCALFFNPQVLNTNGYTLHRQYLRLL